VEGVFRWGDGCRVKVPRSGLKQILTFRNLDPDRRKERAGNAKTQRAAKKGWRKERGNRFSTEMNRMAADCEAREKKKESMGAQKEGRNAKRRGEGIELARRVW